MSVCSAVDDNRNIPQTWTGITSEIGEIWIQSVTQEGKITRNQETRIVYEKL